MEGWGQGEGALLAGLGGQGSGGKVMVLSQFSEVGCVIVAHFCVQMFNLRFCQSLL